jgi:hypothetical protein
MGLDTIADESAAGPGPNVHPHVKLSTHFCMSQQPAAVDSHNGPSLPTMWFTVKINVTMPALHPP